MCRLTPRIYNWEDHASHLILIAGRGAPNRCAPRSLDQVAPESVRHVDAEEDVADALRDEPNWRGDDGRSNWGPATARERPREARWRVMTETAKAPCRRRPVARWRTPFDRRERCVAVHAAASISADLSAVRAVQDRPIGDHRLRAPMPSATGACCFDRARRSRGIAAPPRRQMPCGGFVGWSASALALGSPTPAAHDGAGRSA